jgi:hypothetical protein
LDSLAPARAAGLMARATWSRATWSPRLRRLRAERAVLVIRRNAFGRTGQVDQTSPRVASALRRASCTLRVGADLPIELDAPLRRTTAA